MFGTSVDKIIKSLDKLILKLEAHIEQKEREIQHYDQLAETAEDERFRAAKILANLEGLL